VDIDESPLRADQRPPRPAIDLVFAPRAGLAPRDYFGHLAITYAEFCSQLRQVKGSGGSASRPDDAAATDLLNAVHQFYDTALSWHCTDPVAACTDESIAAQALRLHAMNFGLWHHEDAVRRPGVGDREVARRKRAIDDLNARRNAAIENIDATLLEWFDPDPKRTAAHRDPRHDRRSALGAHFADIAHEFNRMARFAARSARRAVRRSHRWPRVVPCLNSRRPNRYHGVSAIQIRWSAKRLRGVRDTRRSLRRE
jgi:hypothetical protein